MTDSKFDPGSDKEFQQKLEELVTTAKDQGYITYEEINEALPMSYDTPEQIDQVLIFLTGMDIQVLNQSDVERQKERKKEAKELEGLAKRAEGTPVELLAHSIPEPTTPMPNLSRRQWGNVGLALLFTEAVQIMIVAAMVFTFFLVFGLLAIPPSIQSTWTNLPVENLKEIASFELAGHHVVVTWELLKVSTFLATFSGLYFTVYLLTDATYREEFLARLLGEFRVAFAVRSVYLAARDRAGSPTGATRVSDSV